MIGRIQETAGGASSASAGIPFRRTLPSPDFERTARKHFDPMIGRIQETAGGASLASAGIPFTRTLPSPDFEHTAG